MLSGSEELPESSDWPWEEAVFYGSGRDAVTDLLGFLAARGEAPAAPRLWVPSYFCQEVLATLAEAGLQLQAYADGPLDLLEPSRLPLAPGDVLMVVNHFAIRRAPAYDFPGREEIVILEDHSHDLLSSWARQSSADYAFGSLRKTLPVPDGGVLWSPSGRLLPASAPPSEQRELASLRRLAAMVLKDMYLRGAPVDKSLFRRLYQQGENRLTAGGAAVMPAWTGAILASLPAERWREARRRNYLELTQALLDGLGPACLAGPGGPAVMDRASPLLVLGDPEDADQHPFAAVLLTDTPARREVVRSGLIARDVYPAVLWSLESPVVQGIPPEHRDLSRRLLSLHCDARYQPADMHRVAGELLALARGS